MGTACFTGPRPRKLHGYADRNDYMPLVRSIERLCERLADEHGVTRYITGGAQGIDQLAFWAVRRLKVRRDDLAIEDVCHIPFRGQESRWRKDGLFGQSEYRAMLMLADEVGVACDDADDDGRRIRAMFDRNHGMVDASDVVIAYHVGMDGDYLVEAGGTTECMRYARDRGKPMLIIDPLTGESRIEGAPHLTHTR